MPSIHFDWDSAMASLHSFKPYYNWNTFNTVA